MARPTDTLTKAGFSIHIPRSAGHVAVKLTINICCNRGFDQCCHNLAEYVLLAGERTSVNKHRTLFGAGTLTCIDRHYFCPLPIFRRLIVRPAEW